MIKTKEMIVDYRKKRTEHTPILIDGAVMEQVESFKFLGVHITNKLTSTPRQLRRGHNQTYSPQETEIFGMVLRSSEGFTAAPLRALVASLLGMATNLQRVMRTAQYITGAKLRVIQDLYTRRCQRKA